MAPDEPTNNDDATSKSKESKSKEPKSNSSFF